LPSISRFLFFSLCDKIHQRVAKGNEQFAPIAGNCVEKLMDDPFGLCHHQQQHSLTLEIEGRRENLIIGFSLPL
jgi:hypothetical protein